MKKLLSLLLVVLTLTLILSACGTDGGEITTDEQTTTAPEETLPPAYDMDIIKPGETEYVLLRSEDASKAVTDATVKLRNAIDEKYGIRISITTDFEMPNFNPENRPIYEIIVGNVNREESAKAKEGLLYNDAVITVIGTRVVITGGSDDATIKAVDLFIEKYLKDDGVILSSNLRDVTAGEYLNAGVTLGGKDLSEYVLVYGNSYKNIAEALAEKIGEATGACISIAPEKTEKAPLEITIGASSRSELDTSLRTDDFAILEDGDCLHIKATNLTAIKMACAEFIERLLGEKKELTTSDFAVKYVLPDRQEYINDISKLELHWSFDFVTPEWMLDFDEKYAAMMDPAGRLMSCLHRGEVDYYPENSIEGLISSIMMGGDMVEIDPRLTKDGVFILLHDATLTRTTNFTEMAGKNGLPTSANVSDWTYAQLMQLSLKMGAGGDSAEVTSYKIPTLDEAFKVCANRIFIRLDVKGPDGSSLPFWDFEKDIWPLMQKYECYNTPIITWHKWFTQNNYKLAKTYRQKTKELCGKPMIFMLPNNASADALSMIIRANNFDYTMRLTCNFSDYSYKTFLSNNASRFKDFKDTIRMYADVHNTNTKYPENKESHEFYGILYDAGINVQLVNRGLLLCSYIAENFGPAEYKN